MIEHKHPINIVLLVDICIYIYNEIADTYLFHDPEANCLDLSGFWFVPLIPSARPRHPHQRRDSGELVVLKCYSWFAMINIYSLHNGLIMSYLNNWTCDVCFFFFVLKQTSKQHGCVIICLDQSHTFRNNSASIGGGFGFFAGGDGCDMLWWCDWNHYDQRKCSS